MKVLLAHNFYGSSAPSGENTVFDAEKKLLQKNNVTIAEILRHSDHIRRQSVLGQVKGALSTPWNPFTYAEVTKVIRRQQPEILHVHNSFPLFSNAIFHSAKNTSTATVLTLHNYRTFCAAAIPLRLGQTCTECLDKKSALPALKYGCYRNSRLATLPLFASIALHRFIGTWQNHVDAFIALTDFQKDLLVKAGLPKDRVHVKPHFYPNPPAPLQWSEREATALFVGRLGEEKGVRFLLEAWKKWGDGAPQLELIGDGPLRKQLENDAGRSSTRILFHGQLSFDETQHRIAKSRLLILPSICFEGFPMVIREAFALGVPVAASSLGSMPCLVEDGVNGCLFAPGDVDNILEKIKDIWLNSGRLCQMSQAARRTFEEKYSESENLKALLGIYESAIKMRRSRKVRGK